MKQKVTQRNKKNYVLARNTVLFLSLIPFYSIGCFAQDTNAQVETVNQPFSADKINNLNQVLVNGWIYNYNNSLDKHHPYFRNEEFIQGDVEIYGMKFEKVWLKYDLFNQQLIVLDKARLPQAKFSPPKTQISSFRLNDILFDKMSFPGMEDRFFQVVYNNRLKCLYFWEKERNKSYHNDKYASWYYHPARKERFLVIDNKLLKYSHKKSFLKLFPPEEAKSIRTYIRKNNIDLKKSPDSKIQDLILFCENLLLN